jgi:hypothetical protein
LSCGLAGIEQERHARLLRQSANLLDGVDEPLIRGNMRQSDEPNAPAAQRGAQRLNRNLPILVAGQNLDDGTGPLRYLQIGDVAAPVLGCRRAITGLDRRE